MATSMMEDSASNSSNLQPMINEASFNTSRPNINTTNNQQQNRRNHFNKNRNSNNNNNNNNRRNNQYNHRQYYDNFTTTDDMIYDNDSGNRFQQSFFPNPPPPPPPPPLETNETRQNNEFLNNHYYDNSNNNSNSNSNRNNNRSNNFRNRNNYENNRRVINQQQSQSQYNNYMSNLPSELNPAQEASQVNLAYDNRNNNRQQQNRANKNANNRNIRQNKSQINQQNVNNTTTTQQPQSSNSVDVVENSEETIHDNDQQTNKHQQQNRTKTSRQNRTSKNSSNNKYNRQVSMSSQVSTASSRGSKDQNRREILTDQLRKNKYECMICYQYIRNDRAIWSCAVCFHIFHLTCVKKWAQSSTAASTATTPAEKWRCPGCQSPYDQVPTKSTCFCSKKVNPENQFKDQQQRNKYSSGHQLAHSCGEVCGKLLSLSAPFYSDDLTPSSNECSGGGGGGDCKHKCVLLCHPGPCPACETMVTRACKCGKAKFQVKCSSSRVPLCDRACEKMLACGRHQCTTVCHSGECEPCQVDVEQMCSSHGHTRLVKCGSIQHKSSPDGIYQCDSVCGKQLECKNHFCQDKCHSGACKPCGLMPSNLTNCPCGKTLVRELLIKNKLIRTSCKDPVPTCEKTCGKLLKCPHNLNEKTTSEFHMCAAKCHVGECGECERDVEIRCRCGKESEIVKCAQSENVVKLCQRRCQKKKSCSKHQCTEVCCDDKEHICMQVCNKLLACGLHRCEELCHKGACKRCLVASFEERVCQCGATIQYPPIRCGTKPLECPNKCTREHACDHPVSHNCHWEAECPPCSYLTSKMCMGGHEMRHNIACHMKDVSCGKPCNKPLGTCSHRCIRTCHKGECTESGFKCTQPCQKPRPHCEHVCGAPCHGDEPCPDTVCQEIVTVRCKCGLKSKQLKCGQRMYAASQVMFENLASQIKEMLSCKSIDVATFKCQESLKKKHELECDEECFMEERNRNLSQVLLTEASQKPKPIYSEFLKSYAREDPVFAQSIEKKLEVLVNESKLAKTGKKSQNFPVMKQNERRFVHELAAYYGIETQSFDSEPYRNVCVYASREKTGLPAISLTQTVDVRTKQSTMPKLRQLNSKLESGIQSQLKVLSTPTESSSGGGGGGDNIPVSSSFAMLTDEIDEIRITGGSSITSSTSAATAAAHSSTAPEQTNSKNTIDYFDLTD